MSVFAPHLELRARVPGSRRLVRGHFVAVVEQVVADLDGPLGAALGPDGVAVVEAPAHLQPAAAHEERFSSLAFLRPLPPTGEADAELIVPLFSHN